MAEEKDSVRIKLVRPKNSVEVKENRRQNQARLFVAAGIIAALIIGCLFGSMISRSRDDSDELATLRSVYKLMSSSFVYSENSSEYRSKLITDAINGMVDSQGDKFTEYMTADELTSFSNSLDSTFVGIGITYTRIDDSILVASVILDSPAEKAGLQQNDIITAVDGLTITADNFDQAVSSIKGQANTSVELTVMRGVQTLTVTVVRDVISNTITSQVENGIGILTISSFSTGSGEELGRHLASLAGQNVSRLIIDLRGNGGGYLSSLLTMASYFLDENTVIIRQVDAEGNEKTGLATAGTKYKYDKIVILTDTSTASSSEVFALALKEHLNVTIVGLHTYGKGEAQNTQVFSDGSALKYTNYLWYSDNHVSVAGSGIQPDVEVALDDALYLSYLSFEDNESYSYDSVSTQVANIQVMLNFLGYKTDRTDGYFSAQTKKAVTAFQKDYGLTASGTADKTTAQSLNSAVVSCWQNNKDVYDTQMKAAREQVNE